MSARFPPLSPRVTHLVLVDGLPVDSWVVTEAEAGRYTDPDRSRHADPYLGRHTDPDAYGWEERVPWSGQDEAWSRDRDLGWDPDDDLTTRSGYPPSVGPPVPPRPSREELQLLDLEELVGGTDALTALHGEPLPAEPLEPLSMPLEARPVVEEVVKLCGAFVDRWFDAEAHTVLHRLVVVIVAERPEVLTDPDVARSAASLAWMVGRGNGFVGPVLGTHTITNKALLEHFGQPANLVEAFAGRLLPKTPPSSGADGRGRTGNVHRWRAGRSRPSSGYVLGRPEWLVASWRLAIVKQRDDLLRQLADRASALAAISDTAVDQPPLETVCDLDASDLDASDLDASDLATSAPEWERSLRLLSGP